MGFLAVGALEQVWFGKESEKHHAGYAQLPAKKVVIYTYGLFIYMGFL